MTWSHVNCMDIIGQLPVGVYFTDKKRKIVYWNSYARKISGYRPDEVLGMHCHDNVLMHVDDQGNSLCKELCPLALTITDGRIREADVFLSHKDGHRIAVRVHTLPLKNNTGEIIGAAEIFTDISMLLSVQQKAEMLEKMAFFDSLTQLPNREHIETELHARFQEFNRYGMQFGVLFIDIDHFKEFNDTMGHDAGDRILRTVAATLRGSARPFDVFGRWGGEEFVGIIRNIDPENLAMVGNRYLKLIEKSHAVIEENKISITVSIGATVVRPEDTIDTLIRRADRFMYQSKQNGRNRLTAD